MRVSLRVDFPKTVLQRLQDGLVLVGRGAPGAEGVGEVCVYLCVLSTRWNEMKSSVGLIIDRQTDIIAESGHEN